MNIITNSNRFFKNIMPAVFLFFLVNQAFAQQRFERKKPVRLGGAMELLSPGNCHGGMFSPQLSLNKGKHSIFAAGFFQKRSSEFIGGRVGYSINLTDGCSRGFYDDEEDSLIVYNVTPEESKPIFYLSAFLSGQYYHQSLLSKSAVMVETRTSRAKSSETWSSYRMSTLEVSAGVELNFRLAKRVTWKNTVGIAVYNHLDYSIPMHTSRIAPTLMLGTGIHICPL